jgi:putative ABC transport system permease protein
MGLIRYLRRRKKDAELAVELESYIANEFERNFAAGMSAEEAAWAARRKLGNVTRISEAVHEMNTIGFLERLWQDLRYGARQLKLSPSFFVVATLSLALGIGANTAIFQLIDAVRMRLLPVRAPEELVEVRIPPEADHCCSGNFSARQAHLTYPLWDEIRKRQQSFSGTFAFGDHQFNLSSGGEARYAEGLWVTGDFFRTLGVQPVLGRLIAEEDDRPGCGSPGAVISYGFWQQEYAGDRAVLSRSISLDGHAVPIIGVSPPNFYGVDVGHRFDVAAPACAEPLLEGEGSHLAKRQDWWLAAIGRLKPGWTAASASAHLNTISPGILEATLPTVYQPDTAKYYLGYRLTAIPAGSGLSSIRRDLEEPLWILLSIAALVLLIACANLANLMLARASTREREIAVRLALGASRLRVVRQLLAESLLLAAAGAISGALLAMGLSKYMVMFLSTTRSPIFVDLGLDWRVFGFVAALAVLTCLLLGLTPSLRATKADAAAALKSSSRSTTAGRERNLLRRALVVTQVALSMVLLVSALLFSRTLQNLMTLDAGLRPDGVTEVGIDLSRLNATPERRGIIYRDLLEDIRSIPGVESATSTGIVPVSGNGWNDRIQILDGRRTPAELTNFDIIAAGYFQTLGTPLIAGRDFNSHDRPSEGKVAIVNQAFCSKFLRGKNPIGTQFEILPSPGKPPDVFEIVGVTKDAKYFTLRDDFSPTAFVAFGQDAQPAVGTYFLVRSNLPMAGLREDLKRTIAKQSPAIIVEFKSFAAQLQESLMRERLMATLSGFFGGLACLLATVGLYGVVSYLVARRRNEIGVRIALGATRGSVMSLVLREATVLLAAGVSVGVGLAIALGRAASSLLYGLKAYDPISIVVAALFLGVVAIGASILPAYRAARLEPMLALREE